jgi:hypothetical protein
MAMAASIADAHRFGNFHPCMCLFRELERNAEARARATGKTGRPEGLPGVSDQ